MWVGGWYDAEDLAGPLKLFYALEKNGATAPDTLVMGPWQHGGWSRGIGDSLGNLNFASNDFGYDLGLGVMGFFATNVGVRVDLRYFRNFKQTDTNAIGLSTGDFNFYRGSFGVVFRF